MRFLVFLMVSIMAAPAAAQVSEEALRRFVEGYLPHASGSTTTVRIERSVDTPSGTYLVATAVQKLAGGRQQQVGLLADPGTRMVTAGMVYPLPEGTPPVTPATLQQFVEANVSQMLSSAMRSRVRVRWPAVPTRPTGVVTLTAGVSTGYGDVAMPIAVTADGRVLVLGNTWPLNRDPRAVRRELLEDADLQTSGKGREGALLVAEFSDFQCPACSAGWPHLRDTMAQFGDRVQYGMGNFPLVQSSPWSFRAAVAGICVEELDPAAYIDFKEEVYRLGGSITLETADELFREFVAHRELDVDGFDACYMKDTAVKRVLRHMELGHRMGVQGTPTYYAGGEQLPFGNWQGIRSRLAAILEAGGIPESAE